MTYAYAIYFMGFFVRWTHFVGSSDSLFVKFPVEITTNQISFATWNVLSRLIMDHICHPCVSTKDWKVVERFLVLPESEFLTRCLSPWKKISGHVSSYVIF